MLVRINKQPRRNRKKKVRFQHMKDSKRKSIPSWLFQQNFGGNPLSLGLWRDCRPRFYIHNVGNAAKNPSISPKLLSQLQLPLIFAQITSKLCLKALFKENYPLLHLLQFVLGWLFLSFSFSSWWCCTNVLKQIIQEICDCVLRRFVNNSLWKDWNQIEKSL